jgi:hydrogenase maturation protease
MLVIGCGNLDRGDDGAGVMVAERLRKLGFDARILTGEALNLIEAWSGADDVVVVDAVESDTLLGKVWVWDGRTEKIQRGLPISTHGFGVAEAIKLARILGCLPKRLRVFGIEGRRFDVGSEISPEVVSATEEVAKRIAGENSSQSTSFNANQSSTFHAE